jgi:PHD/YefM family antitoxin component YafN of YafNO toxin-antitoxin module
MNALTILEKIKSQKIGKVPVVILPLKDWQEIELMIEEYQMENSENYFSSIKEARAQIKQGRLYEFDLKTGKFKTKKR